jgi:Transposase IS4
MSQLDQPSQTVGDPTDPAGTLRPNLPPEPRIGDSYIPMPAPEFDHQICLPDTVRSDPIALFDLFFSPEILATIVASTNQYGRDQARLAKTKKALNWTDTSIGELYAYLGILIYMARVPLVDTKDYWARGFGDTPQLPVCNTMSRDRYMQINTAFHISNGKSAFAQVI